MAKAHSNSNITGVDLVPVPLEPEQLPPNCQMEIDDINLGLPHFHGRFDMVHMRCVYGGLKGEFTSQSASTCRSGKSLTHFSNHLSPNDSIRLPKDLGGSSKMSQTRWNGVGHRPRTRDSRHGQKTISTDGKR